MELLLNLAWLLLALPAFWLWRRGAAARLARRVSALQFLLALGCVLVLLFPVISVTDDLHAMRAEMEDSAVSKRAVRQAGSDKASARGNRLQEYPLVVARASWLPAVEVRLFEASIAPLFALAKPSVIDAGRAPPLSLLG